MKPFEGDTLDRPDNSPIFEAFEMKEIPPSCPDCSAIGPYPFVLPGEIVGCMSCQGHWPLEELKQQWKESGL